MKRKLSSEAFSFYVSLGIARSYEAVATKFGVSKRAVVKHADRENWQARLAQIESEVRAKADKKSAETLEDMQDRHLKTLQVILRRALEALRSMSLNTASEAVKAIDMVLKHERLIRGGNDATFEQLEARIRSELDYVMVKPGEEDSDWELERIKREMSGKPRGVDVPA